jgi:hypothetical protein
MPIIVKKHRVRVGGETYLPGKVITGLSEEEEKSLVDSGYCEYPFVIDSQAESLTETSSTENSGNLTIDEFIALKSTGQKEHLQKLEVEAGSNELSRVQQYSDWLEAQGNTEGSDENSEEPGPNTSITS